MDLGRQCSDVGKSFKLSNEYDLEPKEKCLGRQVWIGGKVWTEDFDFDQQRIAGN